MSTIRIAGPREPQHRHPGTARAADVAGGLIATVVGILLLSSGCPGRLNCGDCPSDRRFCDSGMCVECEVDAECPGNLLCVEHKCVPQPACASVGPGMCAGACPPGQSCDPEQCLCVGDSVCDGDEDCATGDTCDNGQCETPCDGNEDCAASADGPVCGQDGHCARCAGNSDCPVGICINGECGNCHSNAECAGLSPYCHPEFFICSPCTVDYHCAAGQVCDDGFCVDRFAQNPNVQVSLSNDKAGATSAVSVGMSFAKNELELYTVSLQFNTAFTFNGFNALGGSDSRIAIWELEYNDDGVPDAEADVRSIDNNNAYVDVDADQEHGAFEPLIHETDVGGGSLDVTLPDGGDGDSSTIVAPYSGRVTITILPGVFTSSLFAGPRDILFRATSVDRDTDGANNLAFPNPLQIDGRATIVLRGSCGDGVLDFGEECEPTGGVESADCDTDCTLPFCGDEVLNRAAQEQCDDGSTCSDGTPCTFRRDCRGIGDEECILRSGDGCSDTCQLEPGGQVCGDGVLAGDEFCDDGNTDAGDGCSPTCTEEQGWDCSRQPSCVPVCGDGQVLGGESCDDGNTENGDCCSSLCTFEFSTSPCGDASTSTCNGADRCNGAGRCLPSLALDGTECDDGNSATSRDQCLRGVCVGATAACGNGAIDQGEACDDDNTASGDGCSAICVVELGYHCSGEPSQCTAISLRPGDANCDGRRSAADVLEYARIIGVGVRADCLQDDVDGDGHPGANDLQLTIGFLFGADAP